MSFNRARMMIIRAVTGKKLNTTMARVMNRMIRIVSATRNTV